MISPYNMKAESVIKRIMGDRTSYKVNVHYKSNEGMFYYYINSKGYIHILKPNKVVYREMNYHYYEITDYLLKADGILKHIKSYGNYNTLSDCIIAIEEDTDIM